MLNMKTITFLFSVLFCISVMNAQKKPLVNQKSKRIEKIINSQWTFNYFPAETADKGYEAPGFNDSRWPAISLPHSWNTYETTGEFFPFIKNTSESDDNTYWWIGWGWYRKHFSINTRYSGRKVFVEFERVQKYCKVWINGKYLGDHKGGSASFDFDITQYLKPGEDNVLAVAVNNDQKIENQNPSMQVDNFSLSGGICRNVTLVIKDKLYIPMQGSASHEGGTFITTPNVSEKEGIVRIQTWVKNDNLQKKNCTLQTSILDATNKIIQAIKSEAVVNPGQLYKFDQIFKPIKKPHLWSDKAPYLYKVNSEIIDAKEVVDSYEKPLYFKFSVSGDSTNALVTNYVLNDFEKIYFKKVNENAAITAQDIRAGEPARIILTCSHQKVKADRGSVALLTADIVDSQGNHIAGARNAIRWSVTGPATLTGPSVYEAGINKNKEIEGDWYKGMPVSNVIRSTGKPGKIKATVLASGLASGSVEIEAEEITVDRSVVVEPVLSDEGRKPVTRIMLNADRLEEVPQEIKMTSDELKLNASDKSGFARQIKGYILKNNPSVDSSLIEFKTLIEVFASQLFKNAGNLSADDYNYNTDHYNNCRLISGYINATKLPPQFKEGLKKFYASSVILQGNEKNAGDEMNWLNWIPSGGTVVMYRDGTNTAGIKGVIVTGKSDLPDLIALIHPGFVNFSEEAKERALLFISKMNPYVYINPKSDQSRGGDNLKTLDVSFKAEKAEPILIPLLKFISE